jgi:hypothetical protein
MKCEALGTEFDFGIRRSRFRPQLLFVEAKDFPIDADTIEETSEIEAVDVDGDG